ncbi:MAG: site-2 protease family protein [Planctomycetes bacterium]|nr:site-2 protease family protein [Planctomycetota bacterium]
MEGILGALGTVGNVLIVVLAFSILIFVHELGHFLAALIVGVKPERFFIGFDIYGLGIKKEYNGCVYGIGLLPLGGYVKLAGQSDDPREQKAGRGQPWEFFAKPLWAQAFVLVAGVGMNMLFGFLVLVFMYLYGMPNVPAVVGGTQENSSAAYAGLEKGDRVVAIDGHEITGFNKLREYVALNGHKGSQVFDLTLERHGEVIHRTLAGQPNAAAAGLVMLGIEPPLTARVGAIDAKSPLAKIYRDLLRPGDVIAKIDGQAIANPELDGYLVDAVAAKNPGKTLRATVNRPVPGKNGETETREIDLPVAGVGAYDFGYSVAVEITALMPGYPAEAAGLEPGDKVTAVVVDGKERHLLSQAELAGAIRARAYQPVTLTIRRDGETLDVTVPTGCYSGDPKVNVGEDTFLGVLANNREGVATITEVLPQSKAKGLLRPGDAIVKVDGKAAGGDFSDLGAAVAEAYCKEVGLAIAGREKPVMVRPRITRQTGVPLAGIEMAPLPEVYRVVPQSPADKFLRPGDYVLATVICPDGKNPGGKTVVYWGRKNKGQPPVSFATPAPVAAALAEGKLPAIQGALPPVSFLIAQARISEPLPAALGLAFRDSVDMSLTVYKFLHRLATRDVSTRAMSGPLGIFRVMSATLQTTDPIMELLKLLALISINLAVFNLLPFPVLDGGHVMFIIIEWIKGSPPSDRLREAAQYFGVACLLALMLYVTFNDVSRWAKDSRARAQVEVGD